MCERGTGRRDMQPEPGLRCSRAAEVVASATVPVTILR